MVPPAEKRLSQNPEFLHGLDLYRRGEYFVCHEVLEDIWRESKGPDRLFLQALIHLAVAAYHRKKGNPTGACRQQTKALRKLAGYLPEYAGLDTWALYRGQVR